MQRFGVLASWGVLLLGGLVQPVHAGLFPFSEPTVPAGQAVEISWQVADATSVFLSGFGAVETNGSRTVQAEQSQTFVLVSEGPAGVSVTSQRLTVQGGKGESTLPRPDEFRSPLRGRLTVDSFTALCDRIQDILQDDLKFIVTAYQVPREKFVFLTEPSVRSDLVRPDEPKIGARRLAYLVEIPLPGALPAEVQVTILTWMQYRRKVEETWRVEGNEELHRQKAEDLKQRIIAAAAKGKQP